jgi:multidrug efflux system outer membrane protein
VKEMVNFQNSTKKLSSIVLIAIFSGCSLIPSVGPDYERPADPTVAGWILDENGQKLFSTSMDSRAAWWKKFNDPVLDDIVKKAIDKNLNLQIAQSRLQQARAGEYGAISAFLPTVDGIYGMNRQIQSQRTPFGQFIPNIINQYQLGGDAAWEIDIFGGKRRGLEAAESITEAAEAGLDDTGVTIASEVAKNYLEYRAFSRRVLIAESNKKTQLSSLELVQAKFDAGVVSELDLQQQKSQLETTSSVIPALIAAREQRLYRVAVLLGEIPQSFSITDDAKKNDPFTFRDVVSVSLPAEYLRVRPDVRVAERQLAAQTAEIGVAIADIFPKVNILAGIGVQSIDPSKLTERGSKYWSFNPSISIPIFQPGRIFGAIKNARAKAEEALKNYEVTVLTALEDGQNSLNGYKYGLDRISNLEGAYNASKRALEISQDLYAQGLIDFQRVLESQRQVFSAEDSLLQGQLDTYLSAIAVYKAFAGGLPNEEPVDSEKKPNESV